MSYKVAGVASDSVWRLKLPPRARLQLMGNEAEEKERQRLLDLVNEDLRKEIPALLTDIHQASWVNTHHSVSPITRTIASFASLLGKLSLDPEKQSIQNLKIRNKCFDGHVTCFGSPSASELLRSFRHCWRISNCIRRMFSAMRNIIIALTALSAPCKAQ